jgi:putative DNA-invertase from lambdoid prophage Rac
MICALYARVSTADQHCASQLTELREWVRRHTGYTIHKEYIDHGWSGRKKSRPALDALMKDAQDGYFSAVLVFKLDRFARSAIDLHNNVAELERLNIRFVCTSQGIDTESKNATGKLLLHVLAAIAEFESELIRERIKAGLDHARQHGTRSGKPIGGQKKVFRRDRVLQLRLEGKSFREIASQMKLGLGTVVRCCATELVTENGDGR